MDIFRCAKALVLAAVAAAWSAGAAAQNWPTQPLRLIVPFAAGGATDILARTIADRLHDPIGQSVLVENRPGAGSIVAIEYVQRAAPDGYTYLFGTSALAVNPAVQTVKYDILRDFVPVNLLASVVHVLEVNKDLPVSNVQQLIALARQKPDALSYGSIGPGTSTHLEMEMLKSLAGISMVHVPYNGTPAVLNDLMAGRIQLMFDALGTSKPHIDSGALRALGVTSTRRSALAPNLPTLAESGLPGYEAVLWLGILAPAGNRQQATDRMGDTLTAMMKEPDMAKTLAPMGMEPYGYGPKQFAEFLQQDVQRWAKAAKSANVHLN